MVTRVHEFPILLPYDPIRLNITLRLLSYFRTTYELLSEQLATLEQSKLGMYDQS